MVIDPSGMIQRANPRARELLRLKNANHLAALANFLAAPSAEKLASFWADPVSSARAQSLDASLSTGFPVRIVLRSILPGSHNLLLCMEEGSIVQRADAKWRQLDAELRSVLDSVQVGVVLVDPSGRIRFSNARFGQLFGLVARQLGESANFEELEELIGRRFHDPNVFLAPWKSYAAGAGEPRHDELELTRPGEARDRAILPPDSGPSRALHGMVRALLRRHRRTPDPIQIVAGRKNGGAWASSSPESPTSLITRSPRSWATRSFCWATGSRRPSFPKPRKFISRPSALAAS